MVVAPKNAQISDNVTLVEATAKILGLKNLNSISQHTSLSELGMDSMMIAELSQSLEKDFDISLSTEKVRSLTFAK